MMIMSAKNTYILPRMIICKEGEGCGTKTPESSMNENIEEYHAPTGVDTTTSKNESQKVKEEYDNEKQKHENINQGNQTKNKDHPDPTDAARSDDAEGRVPLAQTLLSKLNLDTNTGQDTVDSPPPKPAISAATSSITNASAVVSPNTPRTPTVVIEIEEKDELPSHYVGRIIGKGGEMIRDLQARSGCRIDVLQNHQVESDAPKIITYRGRRQEDVDFAKRLVFLLCNRNTKHDNHGDHRVGTGSAAVVDLPLGHAVMKEIQVPKSIIGKIIGRGGEMIRELQTVSHARIQVDHSNDYASVEDVDAEASTRMTGVTITGTEESVRRAEEMILFLSNNPGIDGHVLVRHKKTWSEPTTPVCSNFQNSGHRMSPSPPAVSQSTSAYWAGGFGAQGLASAHALPANMNAAGYGSSTSSYIPDGISMSWSADYQYHPSTTPPPLPGMLETDTMPCAKADIGHIIGKRGATINDLQRRSACNIQIDQQASQISITGRSRQGIEMAKQMMQEIIERGPNHLYDGGRQRVGIEQDSSPGQQQQQQLLGYADSQHQSYLPSLNAYSNQQYGMLPEQLQYYGGQQQQPMVVPYQHQIQQQAQDQSYPVPAQQASSPWRVATATDGRIYYYNQDTFETQWDTPAGM